VIYLPEMATTESDMSIVITDGNNSEYSFYNAIKFANYADGSATSTTFDVVRNHHYQYTITKVNTGVNLELTCQVQPWTLVKEEWDYTDVPQTNTIGMIDWNGRNNKEYVEFGPSFSYATFTFALIGPKNATWRAEFVTRKGRQNAFKFVTGDGIPCINATLSQDGFVATGNILDESTDELVTLSIDKTFENNTTGVDDEAYLRISVVLSDGRVINANDVLIPDGVFTDSSKEAAGYIMIHKKM
jgi:hypothetical protein